jgi:hypothetical protein
LQFGTTPIDPGSAHFERDVLEFYRNYLPNVE